MALQKKRKMERYVAILMIIITSVCLTLLGYKGYTLWFVILVLITIGYLNHMSHRSISILFFLLILAILSSLFVTYFTNPVARSGSFSTIILSLWNRLTREQTLGLEYVVYSLIPTYGLYYGETFFWDFTWTIHDLSQGVFFTRPHPSLTTYISILMTGYEKYYAVTTMIIGDFYANWGLVGIVIGCFLYGWLVTNLYIIVLHVKKGIILFPFWIYLSWIFVQMAATGAPIAFFLSELFSLLLSYTFFSVVYIYFHFLLNRKEFRKSG